MASYASSVRVLDDLHLLETPDSDLLREVTGLDLEPSGHALLDTGAGVRSTQRLALGDVGGSVVVLTWPAELQPQAKYLYKSDRARRLLAAAEESDWDVDPRPHLAFWLSSTDERVYLNPTLGLEEYVARWAGPDGEQIGQHDADTIHSDLWPWLLKRGFASAEDEALLGPFVVRLKARKRPAHLRPGLRLLHRWDRENVAELRSGGELSGEIRGAVNKLLVAVGDPELPAR